MYITMLEGLYMCTCVVYFRERADVQHFQRVCYDAHNVIHISVLN